ncbi:MAG: SpoIIE family protein phosphatase [Treponema sp.]|nr:SpoIIE family protein phosphatase [Treponema sp.]
MKKCSALKRLLLLFILTASFTGEISAQELFWENPVSFSTADSRFPSVIKSKKDSYVFWQEVDASSNNIYLSCRHYFSKDVYTDNKRFCGPINYSKEVPEIYSVAISDSGVVVAATVSSDNELTIYCSTDKCQTFTSKTISYESNLIAPRVYFTSGGRFKVYVSTVDEGVFALYSLDSKDGKNWSALKKFSPAEKFRNPFIPVSIKSGSGDLVVFQAQYSSQVLNRLSYQLFCSYTTNDGNSWSAPVLITDQRSLPSNVTVDFASFQNQRANLIRFKNKTLMVWERTETVNSNIWIAEISANGIVPKTARQITENANASRPQLFELNGELYVEWFDTRNGNESVFMAKLDENLDFTEYQIINNDYKNLFSYPLIFSDNKQSSLSFIFQRSSDVSNSICILNPDKSVLPPKLNPLSFKKGKHSSKKAVQVQVEYPSDSSGITGYSYTWGKENEIEPAQTVQYFGNDRTINLTADEDGIYNLIVKVQDRAGNWSQSERLVYNRDLSPPKKPQITLDFLDENGFVSSNTFKVNWQANEENDIAGFNYELEYVDRIPKAFVENKTHLITMEREEIQEELEKLNEKYSSKLEKKLSRDNIITSSGESKMFNNKDNGIYIFRVCAVDEVGNVSDTESILLVLNKYEPQTFVDSAQKISSKAGEVELVINGGGFTYEGEITRIAFAKRGEKENTLVLYREKNEYQINSDSKISGIRLPFDMEEGVYRLGLYHSDRGWYWTNDIINVSEGGTVKIESDYEFKSRFRKVERNYKFVIIAGSIAAGCIVLFALLIAVLFIIIFVKKTKENKLIKKEINSLITGDYMPLLKSKSKKREGRRSLRVKLVSFTIALVIFVIAFVTYQNGKKLMRIQSSTLTSGLQNRVEVLMESLASGVKNFLPTENDVELGQLPDQMEAVSEVQKVLIVGQRHSREGQEITEKDAEDLSYLWATSNINERAETVAGETKVEDKTVLEILKRFEGLNKIAFDRVEQISKQITANSREFSSLVSSSDPDSIERRRYLSLTNEQLRQELNNKLSKIAEEYTNSVPLFTEDIFNSDTTTYTFYKPVLYRQGESSVYLHGAIIAEVDVITLVNELHNELRSVTVSAVILAVIAVVLGALGAFILATFIVRPIRKLENHLEEVGTLMTKSVRERQRLEKKHIDIKSKDEIGRLGEVVNQMTLSAGLAAYEEFLQLDGKAVQERFIPLADGEGGRKLPIVKYNEEKLDLYAFYKGDSAVSGDYFDYQKLDENWYVFIKCDISGHGVPAALLVSVVATKFKDFYYFSNWNYAKNGINLKKFVSAVNDFIFGLGTRGKFSTINISLYNRNTGELYICNAGDNKIHILDGATGKLKEIELSSSPTAGGISTDLIEMSNNGFKVEKTILNRGDVLYLYTDGIDESERLLRDVDFNALEEKEQFGQERITQIIEAVMNRKKYVLYKKDNPVKSEILEFDFTNCKGTIDESILALASVERVFRFVKSPSARQNDEIEIDKILDAFLKEHFTLYSKYCLPFVSLQAADDEDRRKEIEDPNITRYSSLTEDKQADDITLIAIRRA